MFGESLASLSQGLGRHAEGRQAMFLSVGPWHEGRTAGRVEAGPTWTILSGCPVWKPIGRVVPGHPDRMVVRTFWNPQERFMSDQYVVKCLPLSDPICCIWTKARVSSGQYIVTCSYKGLLSLSLLMVDVGQNPGP